MTFDTEALKLVSKKQNISHRSTVSELDSFCQKHVIYDVRSFIHLKTTWLLQYLLQTKRTSAPFPYQAFMRHHASILRYGKNSSPTFPEVLLAHASPNDCGINVEPTKITSEPFPSLAEQPRVWLKLLQLTVEVHSYEGRPGWPLLCSVQVSMTFSLGWVCLPSISGGP